MCVLCLNREEGSGGAAWVEEGGKGRAGEEGEGEGEGERAMELHNEELLQMHPALRSYDEFAGDYPSNSELRLTFRRTAFDIDLDQIEVHRRQESRGGGGGRGLMFLLSVCALCVVGQGVEPSGRLGGGLLQLRIQRGHVEGTNKAQYNTHHIKDEARDTYLITYVCLCV